VFVLVPAHPLRGLQVTVIDPLSLPLERLFGLEIGTRAARSLEHLEVTLLLDQTVVYV
jgi:hypothetical protein